MPCCDHHCHAPWRYWDWSEPPLSYARCDPAARSEIYIQQLEEERALLVQRLARLEQEMEALRRRNRSPWVYGQ